MEISSTEPGELVFVWGDNFRVVCVVANTYYVSRRIIFAINRLKAPEEKTTCKSCRRPVSVNSELSSSTIIIIIIRPFVCTNCSPVVCYTAGRTNRFFYLFINTFPLQYYRVVLVLPIDQHGNEMNIPIIFVENKKPEA